MPAVMPRWKEKPEEDRAGRSTASVSWTPSTGVITTLQTPAAATAEPVPSTAPAVVSSTPGSRPGESRRTVYGRSYYSYGWYSYYPYYWGSSWYYYPWYPPYGYHYWGLPTGCTTINISGDTYYTHDSVYYKETVKEGKVA